MQPMQPDPTASAFAVRGLTKVYGDKAVVDHLNLDVPRGSIYGIVGPNGAGKTTMLGMATGLIRPTEGDAYIWGHNMWTDPIAAKSAMGLLVDDLPVSTASAPPNFSATLVPYAAWTLRWYSNAAPNFSTPWA